MQHMTSYNHTLPGRSLQSNGACQVPNDGSNQRVTASAFVLLIWLRAFDEVNFLLLIGAILGHP